MVAVPPTVVTATLFAPAVPAGVLAVIDVALTTATLVAATPLKVTLVEPEKFVPVMVIAVPPLVGPEVGVMEEIAGADVEDFRAMVCIEPPAIAVTPKLAAVGIIDCPTSGMVPVFILPAPQARTAPFFRAMVCKAPPAIAETPELAAVGTID